MESLDKEVISELAFNGIPDKHRIRSLYWKFLLGYLPAEHNCWDSALKQKRAKYYALKKSVTSLTGPRPEPKDFPSALDKILAKMEQEQGVKRTVDTPSDKKEEEKLKTEEQENADKKEEEKPKAEEQGDTEKKEEKEKPEEKEEKTDKKEDDKKPEEKEEEKTDKKETETEKPKEEKQENEVDKKKDDDDDDDKPKEEEEEPKKKEESETSSITTAPDTTSEVKKEEGEGVKKEEEEGNHLVPPPPQRYISKEQAWRDYYKEDDSLNVIEKDVARTLPALHFFGEESMGGNEHSDALRSILFVYSRTDLNLKYVQGMNEVLAPIYYVFANDPIDGKYAEPDAYFCFAQLMSEIQLSFRREFDAKMLGSIHPVGQFWSLLAIEDRELFVALVHKGIDPRYFALRWISLLFSQEMELPDILRLWDSLFADMERFQFLLFVAVAVLMRMRDQLIKTDFAPCLVLLQDLQIPDVLDVIHFASELRKNTDPACLEPDVLAREYEKAMQDEPFK